MGSKSFLLLLVIILSSPDLPGQTLEKKGYIGIVIGPSIPLGDFAENDTDNEKAGFAKTGFSDCLINFAYGFGRNLGISAALIYSQYDTDIPSSSDLRWMNISFTAGPRFSIPLGERLFIDLKTNLGFLSANYLIEGIGYDENIGKGLGVDLRTSLRYDLASRWCLLGECGYLSSNQKFADGRKLNIQTFNVGLGVAFRI